MTQETMDGMVRKGWLLVGLAFVSWLWFQQHGKLAAVERVRETAAAYKHSACTSNNGYELAQRKIAYDDAIAAADSSNDEVQYESFVTWQAVWLCRK
jgi:hypothetical protein